ncbi:DUF6443 domain-containing protein [Aquimarina sp. D1M17]|uniref:DUF6443 domain-containing protein n=1 Tax=Aquimarina acroporae TaxID=2937283 RepID=UPI0020C0BA20|nr:DUF6443 domain-containing protein [Aquimarina acroporae]MCK8523270.1 DUF6443 domain-containing protein [Aquimarina acroporae]
MNKNIIYISIVMCLGMQLQAQTTLSDKNYVYSNIPQQPITVGELESPNCTTLDGEYIESVTYFDGLGRPTQQRAIKASPNQKDIVTHITYDDLGRQTKEYLPFESNAAVGEYTTVNITNDINTYYKNTYADDFTGVATANINAYAEKVYEDSPLGRVLKQGAPGTAWKANPTSDSDHTIKFGWEANIANEVVRFEVAFANPANTEAPSLIKNNHYGAGELMVTTTKDENWTVADGNNHTTKEYTNKQGQVVLKRTFASTNSASSEAHDTYYVYDDFGNLTYVIPPKVTVNDGVSATELAELCYQYIYDGRNRLVEKKIPGKDWEYIVYDILDRPVFTQHGNQRGVNTGKTYNCWDVTRYDALGRIAYTGVMINNVNRKLLQSRTTNANDPLHETKQGTEVNIAGTMVHYSRNTYLSSSMTKVYTVNYYDTYSFDKGLLSTPTTVLGQAVTTNTKSLPTGSKVRVLGTDDWITTVTYYDAKGRPIYISSENEYLHTTDIIETELDFTGRVLQTKTSHTKGSNAAIVTIDTFEYDHMGRVTQQTQKINSQDEELIASNSYDALGQLTAKNVGSGLQQIDYAYNVRGWLKGINDVDNLGSDLFGFKISYNNPSVTGVGVPALYNGNISETQWKTANDNKKRAYGYLYDDLNRIKITRYTDNMNAYTGQYNTAYSYDKMGNMLTLGRNTTNGAGSYNQIDNLVYRYSPTSNKLLAVTDNSTSTEGFNDGNKTGDDFEYDSNGNMIVDHNKGISSITYNHLNLPETVSISNSQGTGTITYIYDATGAKQKKIVTDGSSVTNTEYAGGYLYKNNTLEFISMAEGYIEPNNSNGFDYVYQYTDNVGNIRLSYKDANGNGTISQDEILEENNYYPFGLKHKGYNTLVSSTNTALNFKYNGVELEEGLGFNLYEMEVRQYDPTIARWTGIDPVTHHSMSTYNSFDNNPVYWADPSGANAEDLVNEIISKSSGYSSSKWKSNEDGTFSASKGRTAGEKNDSDNPPSTEVIKNDDGTYKVVNANDDGDTGIYVVDNTGERTGEIIGETRNADEFINPENGKVFKDFTLYVDAKWEAILRPLAKKAESLDLIEVANESRPTKTFDVKYFYPKQARLLGGKYATSRTAGNFLAGYNAQGATYYGAGISFVTFQKIAGSLHKKQFSKSNVLGIMFKGKTFGPAPFYGEVPYQYRASKLGWDSAIYNYLSKGKNIIR